MSNTRDVLIGGAVLTFFSLFAGFIAYLTKLVLVRNLSVEEYGLFFSVLTVVLFLTVFVSLGLPTGLARMIAKFRVKSEFGKIKSIIVGSFLLQMSIALGLVVVLFFLSDFLAIHYFENSDARWLLVVLSLYLPLNVLKGQFKAIFNGFSKSCYLSLVQFLYNLGLLFIVLVGFYFYNGVYVAVSGYIGAFLGVLLLLSPALLKTFSWFKTKISAFRVSNQELLLFSLPLVFTAFGAILLSHFDTLMLTFYTDLVVVGVYNIVYPTALLLAIIGSSLGLALLPVITRLFEEGKKKYISRAFSQLYVYVFALVVPLIVVLMVLAEDIIRVFFGAEYLIGLVAFQILVFSSIFKVFIAIYNQALIGIGRSSAIFWIFLVGSLLNVILNVILIPQFSLTGAAIATILSFIVMVLISHYLLQLEVSIVFPIWKLFLIIICSLSIFLSLFGFWLLPFNVYLLTFMGVFVGLLVYASLLLIFGLVSLSDFFRMAGLSRYLQKRIFIK